MRVHAIQTGRVRIKTSQIVGRGHGLKRRLAPLIDNEWSPWLPTLVYAIEHRDGVILVDAGASAANKSLPRWHPYFRNAVRFDIEPDEEAGPQLRAIGIRSGDVRRVVLTHLHIDHDGGLGAFPTSEVLVSPGELRRASGIAPAGCADICRSAGPSTLIRSLLPSTVAPMARLRARSA
jgi:glyoxylase-like metal-dependent hydrolase (beta-lactamase superfamily II)